MCGIIGYIGMRPAAPILIEGLKRLEYRGYDSAGIAVVLGHGHTLESHKTAGKVSLLSQTLERGELEGSLGIGHTRWATHGEPSRRNAHPHASSDGSIAVVHNGIIENHERLRAELVAEGVEFESDTDTEVLPHLIYREFLHDVSSLESAVERALAKVEGAYAIAVISSRTPDTLIAACNSSPLVIGIGESELFVASDETALAGKVNAVAHLKDGELAVLKRNGRYTFRGIPLAQAQARFERPTVKVEDIGKQGFAHYMLKEIYEQPQALHNVLSHLKGDKPISFGGLTGDIEARLRDARRIILTGCGTSLFAAMAGAPSVERLGGVICEAEQAAEFAYRVPLLTSQDVVIGISQSGETADTLKAMDLGKERHALCLSVTNRVGSTLAKRTRLGMYLHAGPEIAVASTKAFTSQVTLLVLFALRLAELKGGEVPQELRKHLSLLPSLVHKQLEREEEMRSLTRRFKNVPRMIFIGRGSTLPLALEGALKVREVAYLDAHGLSAAELKHGTLALVEKGTPVVALMPGARLRGKMVSNLEEVRTRGGEVIPLQGPEELSEELLPIVLAPLVQLLAYHLGVARGVDVDQPRNLAKAVTVE